MGLGEGVRWSAEAGEVGRVTEDWRMGEVEET